MSNLRIRYAVTSALFLISTSVSAIPMEQVTRRDEDEEQNSSSLEQTIEDAVHLDKDIQASKGAKPDSGPGSDSDSDSDGEESDDDDDEDEAARNDSRNRPSISSSSSASPAATVSPTALADSAATTTFSATISSTALPVSLPATSSSSNRNAVIAGGTIGALVFLAIIGFFLYRWRKNKKPNNGTWINEKCPQSTGPAYPQTPPSTLFGGGSSQRAGPVPTMPKPPPLVLVNDRSPFRDPDMEGGKHSDDGNSDNNNNKTFFLEPDSNRSSQLPPVYEELRSPGMESSISQTAPYPGKPATRKVYASFAPPPIPETRDVNVSRFSWTTKRSSVESEPKFRTIHSWVSHQAGRMSVKEKLAQMGLEEGAPPTPVAFRFHPGAPVTFGVSHGRMESEDLDRQMRAGR